ncbi:hypothetical protein RND81_11G194000 [Saponaria officinalis]|uniref:NB-ARC domain-containing protein n=1 Tax=Saponaria officinalis TaxID=3572 RepID=A0AAW1HPH9_SAPOF
MAEQLVIWENLKRKLVNAEDASQPLLKKELEKLLDQVEGAQGLVAALEGRNHIHRTHANREALHDHSDNLIDNVRHGLLEKLSALFCKADDLLDQILTSYQRTKLWKDRREGNQREGNERAENGGIQRQLVQQGVHAMAICTQEVSLFLSQSNQLIFPRVMAGRVEKVRKKMEKLVGQLLDEPGNQPDQRDFQHIGSVEPDQHTVTGRRDDTKKIVNMLLQPHRDNEANISVICMSGLPGVGKTALAKHIYDDQKIKSHFDLRMWISVSQVIDEKKIIRGIVESCTSKRSNHQNSKVIDTNPFRDLLGCRSTSVTTSSPDNSEIDIYERRLRREIREKLYLLVLDDVDQNEWQCLRDLLAGGARGSRILMTTQSTEVADRVKREFVGAKVYPLQGLSKIHSRILFKRMASEKDAYLDKEMKQAGFEIVDICKYVPLTIKVAARYLQGKSREEWLSFTAGLRLSQDQREGIMEHMLHLSYSDLPPRLRACFTYCSLFPEDFTFNKHDLISLWIAQGYVELDVNPDVNPQDRMSLEHAGEKYFMELSRRCFFEDVKTDELKNILTCKMHHIVRKLASNFTAAVSNVHVTDSGMIHITDPTAKHVTVNCGSHSSLKLSSPILKDPRRLRTLIFVTEPDCDIKVDTLVSNQLISTYRRLRVLDLHDLGVNELPDAIGDQIHLRYLDVSKNDGLVTLPKSFTRLCNLQTLKLNSCPKLKQLAIDFGLLVNLRCFEVDECESLTCMPLGLDKLTQLETLSRFVVGNGSSKETAPVGLQALSRLTRLRGRLAIHFTGDWMTNIPEARQSLSTKNSLVEVKISWAQRSDAQVPLEEEILNHGETLENLKPYKDLKILRIEGYKGNDFPSWANKDIMSSLPKLVIISIEGCGKCRYLPPFGKLAHLKKLTLRHMANVQFVEDTLVMNRQQPMEEHLFFPSLQELTLHNFYNLEGWQQEVASAEQAETRTFPCLSKLRIWNCPKLISFPSFTGVSDLDLQNVNHLLLTKSTKTEPRPKNKVYTRDLQIKGCLDLKDFGKVRNGLEGLPSLTNLVIDSCDALISLAEVGQITSLERLEISNCKELDLSDLSDDSETQRSVVEHTHRVPRHLRHLRLRDLPKMGTLPDGLRHVKTLKTMWISACKSLESLPEWISSLTSLQHLRIESCRALKRLPEGLEDVKSLMKVEIIECPELIERCREHKGEDWPKIKHARVLLHKSRRYGYV